MRLRYLLDTNTCIYIIKRAPEKVYRHFSTLAVGEIGISAVTYGELQFGVAKSARPTANQAALYEFLAPLEVLDFPAAAGESYGRIRAELERSGRPIGQLDLLIGVHCLHLGATLVTNNQAEFSRICGLETANWV